MQEMAQTLHFGQPVADLAWGSFLQLLDYKLEDQGKKLVKVNKWFPSSKTCHNCGYIFAELTLDMRSWECPICHTVHDRDKNAALNIKNEGMRIVSA